MAAHPIPAPERADAARRDSYGRILHSSALIGSVSVVNVATGLLRAKVVALLLGPTGIGLLGILTSIYDLARSITGLGISESGVRRMSEASAKGDDAGFARTAATLRCLALAIGMGACLIVAGLAGFLSQVTFNSAEHRLAVVLVGLAVCLRLMSDARGAPLQALRRIGDLARINLYGGLVGTAAGLAAVWAFGSIGVALVLVTIAAAGLLWTLRCARRLEFQQVRMNWAEHRAEARALFGLGIAFMATGLLMMGAMYLIRLIVIRHAGLDAAGLYQAAWALGSIYITLLLHAMGTDFYPRISALAADHEACNRLINEQAHVSVLLAGPGILCTLALAEPALSILYSTAFVEAADALRWICLGITLRVVCWPVGYVIIAKQCRMLFVALDVAWFSVFMVLAWILVQRFAVVGAGIAFFLAYLLHTAAVLWSARRLTGFALSPVVLRLVGGYTAAIVAVALAPYVLPRSVALVAGVGLTLAAMLGSLAAVSRLSDSDLVPSRVRRLLSRTGSWRHLQRDRHA